MSKTIIPKFDWEIKNGSESFGFAPNIHYATHHALMFIDQVLAAEYERSVVIPKEQKRIGQKLSKSF